MAYSNKFVACVVVDGRVQKELANGTVAIPFGSEYILRFRNKNNRRAVVKFSIDGENVSGGGYIIEANSKIDIRRHSDIDRAFKFVELDSEDAIEHGKSGPNLDKQKGLIECSFFLEKEYKPIFRSPQRVDHHHHHYHPPLYPYTNTTLDNSVIGSIDSSAPQGVYTCSMSNMSYSADQCIRGIDASETLDDGCTVEGSMTGQNFHTAYINTEEACTTVKLFLQGFDPDAVINRIVPSVNLNPKLSSLEKENEELRIKIAELENEQLRKKLAKLKK